MAVRHHRPHPQLSSKRIGRDYLRRRPPEVTGAILLRYAEPYGKTSECCCRKRSKCAVGVIGVMEVRITDFTAPNPRRVR